MASNAGGVERKGVPPLQKFQTLNRLRQRPIRFPSTPKTLHENYALGCHIDMKAKADVSFQSRIHMRIHLLLLLDMLVLTPSATRAASVKASLTPRFRFAEHSIAPISC